MIDKLSEFLDPGFVCLFFFKKKFHHLTYLEWAGAPNPSFSCIIDSYFRTCYEVKSGNW